MIYSFLWYFYGLLSIWTQVSLYMKASEEYLHSMSSFLELDWNSNTLCDRKSVYVLHYRKLHHHFTNQWVGSFRHVKPQRQQITTKQQQIQKYQQRQTQPELFPESAFAIRRPVSKKQLEAPYFSLNTVFKKKMFRPVAY